MVSIDQVVGGSTTLVQIETSQQLLDGLHFVQYFVSWPQTKKNTFPIASAVLFVSC